MDRTSSEKLLVVTSIIAVHAERCGSALVKRFRSCQIGNGNVKPNGAVVVSAVIAQRTVPSMRGDEVLAVAKYEIEFRLPVGGAESGCGVIG